MREYTVVEYEQEDFDKIAYGMTPERAVEILSGLPRGWFPYNLPDWGCKVTTSDLDHYEICCAINKAIEALRESEENGGQAD